MDKIIIDAHLQKPFQAWDTKTIDDILMIYRYNDFNNYYNIVLNKFREYVEWRKFNETYENKIKLKNLIDTYLFISKSLILYNQVNYYEIYETLHYTSIIDSFLNMTTDTVFFFIIIFYLFFRVFSSIYKIIEISKRKEKISFEERPIQQNIYKENFNFSSIFDIIKELKNPKENYIEQYPNQSPKEYPKNYSELNNNNDIDIKFDFDFNSLGDFINMENLEDIFENFIKRPDTNEKNRCCANCNLKKKVD